MFGEGGQYPTFNGQKQSLLTAVPGQSVYLTGTGFIFKVLSGLLNALALQRIATTSYNPSTVFFFLFLFPVESVIHLQPSHRNVEVASEPSMHHINPSSH